jgi:hypothetical protein
MSNSAPNTQAWPHLDWPEWQASAENLHMLTQMVGKTRLGLTHRQNHWWNVPLYVTARGLSTSAMPLFDGDLLEIEFDFFAQQLTFRRNSGAHETLPLQAQSIADFYAAYLRALKNLAVEVRINPMPVELPNAIRFDLNTAPGSYDGDAVRRFWKILIQADTLFHRFSSNFYGKISPVHFFWGSFDLAVTRFNGKRAPPRVGADEIQAEAYSHECISAGFWPGNGGYGQPAFYCYAAPVPAGLQEFALTGRGAFNPKLGEFLLNYNEVQALADPSQAVLDFLTSTYSACADAAKWDRASLDRTDLIP